MNELLIEVTLGDDERVRFSAKKFSNCGVFKLGSSPAITEFSVLCYKLNYSESEAEPAQKGILLSDLKKIVKDFEEFLGSGGNE